MFLCHFADGATSIQQALRPTSIQQALRPTSMSDVHNFVTLSCMPISVQLNKCGVCGSVLQRGDSNDGGISASILLGKGMTGC